MHEQDGEISIVLFDWDGTGVKTREIWDDAVAQTARMGVFLGRELTTDEIRTTMSDFEGAGRRNGLAPEVAVSYANAIRAVAEPQIIKARYYDGFIELLKDLADGEFRLGIVSTFKHVAEHVERRGLKEYFDVIVGGGDVAEKKPAPDGILLALQRLDALGEKHRAVYVGDEANDINAAISAGIKSILFCPHEHSKTHDVGLLRTLNPTHRVRSHCELGKVLMKSRNGG